MIYGLKLHQKHIVNKNFYNFESLKEDEKVTAVFKQVKKNSFKATKYGKSAISFRSFEDLETAYGLFDTAQKSRCRMITLEGDKRGCEITKEGSAVQEFRIQSLKEIVDSI